MKKNNYLEYKYIMSGSSNQNIKNSKSRFLRLSSEDKSVGTNGRFTIDLLSSGGIIDNVKGYIVHSIQCPNVFPNIPDYANILTLIKATGPVTYNITIPVAYYFLDDLVTQLQTSINAVIADTVAVTKTGTFPNEKINFVFTGDSYTFDYSESTIADQIGLLADQGPSTNTTMTSIPNLNGETDLYVHSRTLCPNNLMEGTGSFSVLDKLNLDEPYGAMCYTNFNNDSTHFKKYFPFESLKSIRTVQLTIRNRTGNILILPENFNISVMLMLFYK
jgi:hypothetical protein